MIIFPLIFVAVNTVLGTGGFIGLAMIQFFWSLINQIEIIFKLVKNNSNKMSAAVAVMIIPLALLFCYVLITGMGMDYFLTHNQSEHVLTDIQEILFTPYFTVELWLLMGLFVRNSWIFIPLSQMKKKEIILSFGVPILTFLASILLYIGKLVPFIPFFLEELPKLHQVFLRLYAYGIASVVLTTITTSLGLGVYRMFVGKFPKKRKDRQIILEPWEVQDISNRRTKKMKREVYLSNRKKEKDYIFGNTRYYLFGIFSVCIGTVALGLNSYRNGQENTEHFVC